jgi:putative transposase
MAEHMRFELVEAALDKTASLRGSLVGTTFHSDRGSQGGFNWSSQHLDDGGGKWLPGRAGEERPGRVATCFDSSAESFFSSLKRDLVHRYRFATRAEAITAITAWIKRYHAVRLHSAIGYVPPIEWELKYPHQEKQAA